MIDLHCHILPEIDDGSKDLDTSLKMLDIANANETQAIVATPHVIEGKWLPAWEKIINECKLLEAEAGKNGLNIPVYPGAEVAVHWDILEIATEPGPYCINGGRYMLVELPAMDLPGFTEDFFFTLQTRGITPVLAHPERHPVVSKRPELLAEWIARGILVQVNGASITGKMGETAMRAAEQFLISNMVHCIGSDAHSARHRNPSLTSTVERLHEIVGREVTHRLLVENPNKVVNSLEICIADPVIIKTKKNGFFSKFLAKMIG